MGLWRDNFHWKVLLGWEVLGWIIGTILAIAGILFAIDQYVATIICFAIVAMFLFAKISHLAATSSDVTLQRLLFTFLCFGIVGIGLVEISRQVLNWKRQHETKELVAPAPVGSESVANAVPTAPLPAPPSKDAAAVGHRLIQPRIPDYSNGLAFQADLAGGDYQEGIDVGGIKWEKKYTDVRITIKNTLDVAVEKVDLLMRFDIHIAGAAQLGTAVSDVSIVPGDTEMTPISLGSVDAQGKSESMPIVPTQTIIDVYRIACPRLPAKGQVKFIVATIALNPATGSGPNFSAPATLFAAKRPPKNVNIRGTYETGIVDGARRYPIEFSHDFN